MPRKLTKQELDLLSKVRHKYEDLYKVLCKRKRRLPFDDDAITSRGLCYAVSMMDLSSSGRTLRDSITKDSRNWEIPKEYKVKRFRSWLCKPFGWVDTLEEQKALVEIRLQVLDWYLKYKVI